MYSKPLDKTKTKDLSKKGLVEYLRKHSNTLHSVPELRKMKIGDLRDYASTLKYKG